MELLNVFDGNGKTVNIHDALMVKTRDVAVAPFAPLKSYEWEISQDILEEIKLSNLGEIFRSDPFRINGFDFILSLSPRENIDGEEKCLLRVHLLKLPPFVSAMTMMYSLKLKQTDQDVGFTWMCNVDHNKNNDLLPIAWDDDCISFQTLMGLNSLKFCCDIQILDAYDSDPTGNDIDGIQLQLQSQPDSVPVLLPKSQHFMWKFSRFDLMLKQVITADSITSEIFELFGIKWYLSFIPKYSICSSNVQLTISIADLPANIAEIAVYFKLCMDPMAISKIHTVLLMMIISESY